MSRNGDTTVDFNPAFFDNILRSAEVDGLCEQVIRRAYNIAHATAPYDEGDYQAGLKVEKRASRYRNSWRLVGDDWKTLLLEAKLGHLTRSLRAAKA